MPSPTRRRTPMRKPSASGERGGTSTRAEVADDPRRLAWEALIAVEGGAFADGELGRRLSGTQLDARDRALAAQLVYGTLTWQGQLDYRLAQLGKRADDLDVAVRVLLRMGLFQLSHLTRVPEFAAVDTSVELSKSYRKGAASGLVNALLRRYLRERDGFALPARDDLAAHLSITHSHPRWLVEHWLTDLGADETEALLAADNQAAPTVLRVNRTRAGRETVLERFGEAGIAAHGGTFSPLAIILDEGTDVTALPGFSEGLFSTQGEASQLVGMLLAVQPGEKVLDACAAPGGKATHLAEQMDNQGRVVAIDVNVEGLRRLRAEAGRLGLAGLHIERVDVAEWRGNELFDAVLVDAPCSGLGTLRQHPEIKWRRTPQSIAEIARLQTGILRAAAARVRAGGRLVYSTCTIMHEENEDIVRAFLAENPDFALDDPGENLPAAARHMVGADGFLRTSPRHDLDGFFAVRFRR